MKTHPPISDAVTELRRQAEKRLLEQRPEPGPGWTEADTQRLIHELQVHQIELEMQYEELQQAHDDMELGLEKYSDLYDFAPVGYLTLDRDGTILESNLASSSLLGLERARLFKRRLGLSLSTDDRRVFAGFLVRVFEGKGKESCELTLLPPDQPPVEVRMEATKTASGRECRAVCLDITASKQAAAEQARLLAELQDAQSKIKILNGLLPICAFCKKIRDDRGCWNQLEQFIQKHSEAHFTHGYCPECAQKHFPDATAPAINDLSQGNPSP